LNEFICAIVVVLVDEGGECGGESGEERRKVSFFVDVRELCCDK
jgi:hypothetical protein